ncbi:hypothetical protein HY632_01975 [Candidatus Uhrbacteria bacterium]|nr:hypothetical protein [Candidatus Uhrbacteria bacterium]
MTEKTEIEQALANETFKARVTEAAEVLGIKDAVLVRHLVEELGADTTALLRRVTFQDIAGLEGAKPAKVRAALDVFQQEDITVTVAPLGKDPAYVGEKKAAKMSMQELLAAYDPRDADNAVGKRLSELTKGKRCIVFADDKNVDVDASLVLINELRDAYPERETYVGKGQQRPRSTFRIGERQDQMADENPLYRGRMLRPDGTCDQTQRSWEGVPHEVRVLLHLAAAETRELVVTDIDRAHAALDLAMTGDAAKCIRQRYARASVRYDELQTEGKLPTLKIRRSGATATSGSDPFFRGQQPGHVRT